MKKAALPSPCPADAAHCAGLCEKTGRRRAFRNACADRFPTPAPTEEPEVTDPNETDEADYYF